MDPALCAFSTYRDFVKRCPEVGAAWGAIEEAGREGPLDERTSRLVSLGIAIGALRQEAVQANVRKAISSGLFEKEIEQVMVLAAGTLGVPDAIMAYSWIREIVDGT